MPMAQPYRIRARILLPIPRRVVIPFCSLCTPQASMADVAAPTLLAPDTPTFLPLFHLHSPSRSLFSRAKNLHTSRTGLLRSSATNAANAAVVDVYPASEINNLFCTHPPHATERVARCDPAVWRRQQRARDARKSFLSLPTKQQPRYTTDCIITITEPATLSHVHPPPSFNDNVHPGVWGNLRVGLLHIVLPTLDLKTLCDVE